MNETLVEEAERLHAQTAEVIIQTAEARAVLERLKANGMVTPEQVMHAAQNYRTMEAKVQERVRAEIDFYYGVATESETSNIPEAQ